MLKITIPGRDYFDEYTEEFVHTNDVTLKLEHSLLSISKWESKWEVPFLHDDPNKPKTNEMLVDYVRCMTMNDVASEVYDNMPQTTMDEISAYIGSKQSATTFTEEINKSKGKQKEQILTSELLYYYMVAAQIPLECEKWHINRLINLIKIYSIHNEPEDKKPKVGKRQAAMSRHELNKQRQKMYNTKG